MTEQYGSNAGNSELDLSSSSALEQLRSAVEAGETLNLASLIEQEPKKEGDYALELPSLLGGEAERATSQFAAVNQGFDEALDLQYAGQISTSDNSYSKLSRSDKAFDLATAVLSETPSYYYDELSHRITHEPIKVAKNVAVGTAVGFGAVGLVRRFPMTGKLALGSLLAYQAIDIGRNSWNFLSEGSKAENFAERNRFVEYGARSLAHESVNMTEMLPGIMAGGLVAGRTNLIPNAEAFARRTYAFHGPGSHKMPNGILNRDGTVDIFKLDSYSRSLDAASPAVTRESARVFDLVNGRVSRRINGSKNSDSVHIGFPEKDGYFTVHRHPVKTNNGLLKPGETMAESTNVVASSADRLYTRGTGMIHTGDYTTVYAGQQIRAQALRNKGVDVNSVYLPGEGLNYRFSTVGTTEFAPQIYRSHSLGLAGDEAILFNSVNPSKASQVGRNFDVAMPTTVFEALNPSIK